jgi:NADH-quinone oxidoreductase subunit J
MYIKYAFIALSVVTILSALMVLISRKPIQSVLYVTLSFFSIAGHYILLNAQFLAVVHIIVYAGAIMVLFLFTVMLLNLNIKAQPTAPLAVKLAAVIAAGILMITLVGAIRGVDIRMVSDPSLVQVGLAKNLGKVLFTEYIVPFELSTLLFLSAMVGAVLLGKKEKTSN